MTGCKFTEKYLNYESFSENFPKLQLIRTDIYQNTIGLLLLNVDLDICDFYYFLSRNDEWFSIDANWFQLQTKFFKNTWVNLVQDRQSSDSPSNNSCKNYVFLCLVWKGWQREEQSKSSNSWKISLANSNWIWFLSLKSKIR